MRNRVKIVKYREECKRANEKENETERERHKYSDKESIYIVALRIVAKELCLYVYHYYAAIRYIPLAYTLHNASSSHSPICA